MSNLLFKRVNSHNSDFVSLVKLLDAELAIADGDDHDFYNQFNKIDQIKYVLLCYQDDLPIACGALKAFKDPDLDGAIEIKRMFTQKSHRGKGVASSVLNNLERWAADLGFKKCRLETGKRQPDAIALYKKNEYQIISNYGQYRDMENSICFEKAITP